MEPRIYKVAVMYSNLSVKEAVTIYVLAFSGEEAEKRATNAMSLILGRNPMEYLVDRTVNCIAISSRGESDRMDSTNKFERGQTDSCNAGFARPLVSLASPGPWPEE